MLGPSAIARHAERGLRRLGLASGVLMYHRVASESLDPWDLCVTPMHFAEQMELLKAAASCEALGSFLDGRWQRASRRARVAVTFDDGYRDNLTQALPILERFEIPATIFIVSGAIGSEQEFWWDTLERCLLRPARVPPELVLEIAGAGKRWTFADREGGSEDSWRADADAATERQRAFLDLWGLLVTLDRAERAAHLDALRAWAGVDEPPSPERSPLSVGELEELAEHPLITIGCHTAEHSSLPDLSPAEQRREIERCRQALEEWTGRRTGVFSYPYGRYDQVTAAIVRDLGFELACTSRPAVVTPLSRAWAIPRLQATDGDGDTFGRWLRSAFGVGLGAMRA